MTTTMAEDGVERRRGDTERRLGLGRRAVLGGVASGAAGIVAGCNSLVGGGNSDGGSRHNGSPGTSPTDSPDQGLNTDRVRVGILLPVNERYQAEQMAMGFFGGLHHKGGRGFPDSSADTEFEVSVGPVDYEHVIRRTVSLASASNVAPLVDEENVDVVYGGRGWVDLLDIARGIDEATGEATYFTGPAGYGLENHDLCRDWVFHTGETFDMDGRTGALYLRDHADIDRAFLIGRRDEELDIIDRYRGILHSSDVELVGQRILYQDVPWSRVFDMAAERGVDAVVVGARPSKWAGAYATLLAGEYDFRLVGPAGGRPSFDSLSEADQEAADGTPRDADLRTAGVGPLTCRYHPTQYDNPTNEAFVRFVVDQVGVLPDESAAAAFTAASALHQAVLAVRAGDAASIPAALHGATIADTPKGSNAYEFQRHNNQARSPMTVVSPKQTPDQVLESWHSNLMPTAPLARVPATKTAIPANSPALECTR